MKRARQPAPSAAIAIMLYVVEMAVLLCALALYKKGVRPLGSFLITPVGGVLIIALATLVAAVLIIVQLQRKSPERARSFWPTVFLNVWSVVLLLGAVEITLRVLATNTPAGPVVANVALLPKDWKTVAARNQAVLRRAAAQETYLIYDSELGWTIGPNRRSRDYNRAFQERYLAQHDDPEAQKRLREDRSDQDIYLSSTEGLRSPRAGMSFASVPARRRVALIGDSFTFGLEVGYEQTWGHQLERALGPEFQILNFGVDGYGVDQAYLRYRRDAARWHPEIVILSVVTDDLRRTMCVYGFLCFPWSEIPFAKPRFVLNADTLALLKRPLPMPDSIFASKSINQLPFIGHDPAFDPAQWQGHFYYRSFAVRFLLSKFPRWPIPGPDVTEEALQDVNAALIRTFVRTAKENGSIPVVVFFPSRGDFAGDGKTASRGKEVVRASGIPFIDATACVAKVQPVDRFVVLHYSPATNAAVAQCLQEPLARIMAGRTSGPTS